MTLPASCETFAFGFSPAYRLPALAFGITPRTATVLLSAEEFRVRFGLWSLVTSRANIAGWEVTGDYTFAKSAGPAHLSLADRGVTFATNGDRGLCIRFREPVRALDPTGRLRHPAVTVTVADPAALITALEKSR